MEYGIQRKHRVKGDTENGYRVWDGEKGNGVDIM